MKLAVIFPESLPLKKARAVSVVNTVAELSKLVDTTFVIPESSASKKEIEDFYGVDLGDLRLLRLKNRVFGIKSSKVFNFFFRRHLKNFDVFYVRHLKVAKFLGDNKLPHQKVVFEVHEVFSESLKEENPFKKGKIEKLKKLETQVYSKVDAIVFINKTLQKFFLGKFNIHNPYQEVIYLSVKEVPSFVKKDFSRIKEVFYCGSFYKWKGLEVMFYALKWLPEFTFYIVGDGSEERKKELEMFAKSLGIEKRVKFLGYRPQEEVYEILLNQAKLTIIPNTKSVYNFFSFPLKMLEYMATSNIVIAADTPVIKEVIKDKKNGFLFKTGDPEALKNVIQTILSLSPDMLQKVAFNAYQTASKFTYSTRAKKLLEFFYKLQ